MANARTRSIRSQLNHVADTTCRIVCVPRRSGMGVAYTSARACRALSGRIDRRASKDEQRRDTREFRSSARSGAYRYRTITRRYSSTASKRPISPASAGLFSFRGQKKAATGGCLDGAPGRPRSLGDPAGSARYRCASRVCRFRQSSPSFLPLFLHQPHFESPQFKQVMQPSIMITAAVLHLAQSCAPSGKCVFAKASVCLARASYSARFSSTSLR
jgi:hypothetical protein